MVFWQLVVIEGLLLFATVMTILAGMRGIMAGFLILTSLTWMVRKEEFLVWELPLLLGVLGSLGLLLWFTKKAGQSQLITGIAGGIASLVVFGAFLTPLAALLFWALIVGTGLIPRLRQKQVIWGITPFLWRTLLGFAWLIYGNLLL